MNFDYDVVIIGGAFSGAATALMLKRKRPEARVLIIEKTTAFDRKVGESTTEVSSCYMTRILGLTHYLGHHQLPKQGLRLWFSNRSDQPFDDCVEIGTRYQSRLPGFQVDRAKLDSHMLDLACRLGCDLWRPAKVTGFELNDGNGQTVNAVVDGEERTAACRWIVDATGRAAMFARKLGYFRPNTEHPINAVWARFSGVKEWDSYEWRERFPDYANCCRTGREWATNHLFGRGWWVWIIPLQGGDVSAGIVYDSRIFKFPEGPTLGQRLHAHILNNPVGREIFGAAKVIEGDVHALSMLPYHSEKVCDDGWAMVGDAAGFIDPLYSPGLDFCSYTSYYVADLLARSLKGEDVTERLHHYNQQYPVTYRFVVREFVQGQILLHGRRRLNVSGAASRCEQLLHRLSSTSLSRSGIRVSYPALHWERRQIRPECDELLQSPACRSRKSPMGDRLLRKKKRWLARTLRRIRS